MAIPPAARKVPTAPPNAPTIRIQLPLPGPVVMPAARGTRPPAPAPAPARAIPMPAADAGDAGAILDLVRRVALQRDLASAVGVIDLGLADLAAAGVAIAIVGADAAIWSPRPDDLRTAAGVVQLDVVARIARGHQPAITPRALVVPCDASIPNGSTAAIIAHRPPTAPPFDARDVMLVAGVANQVAPLLRGFLVDHAARTAREAADRGGLFRAEALAQARVGGQDGRPIFLSATWLRWAYPTILGLVAVMIAAAALIEVPSYSTGSAIVSIDGEKVTCATGGTVASIEVTPGQEVKPNDVLIRLHATDEEADLERIDAEYRVALSAFLFEPLDQGARAALSTIAATRQRGLASVDSRVIRATRAGVVNDVRVRTGELLLPGAPVLSIVDRDAQPSIIAFLPGSDRPRLEPGMTLQLQLAGYNKAREEAVITEVGAEVIGAGAARKYLGETVGDALPLNPTNVIVHARLAGRTFAAGGNTYTYHDGMTGVGEVRVESKSFLRTLVSKE